MSTRAIFRGRRTRLFLFLLAYLAIYLVASFMDLWTTSLGLQRPGVSEKNVFAVDAGGDYQASAAWLLTLGGAIVMAACALFAARYAEHVDRKWLLHPVASFGQVYLNPWSRAALAVSPLHVLSFILGFVLLRVAAAANNLSVYLWGWGPMGAAMKSLSAWTSPLAGFCIVAFACFFAAVFLAAPVAARIIRFWQEPR